MSILQADYNNLETQHSKKLVLSSNITPESQKYHGTSQHNYTGNHMKSHSFYGETKAFENGASPDYSIEKEHKSLHKPQLEGRSDRYMRDSEMKPPATRANGTFLSQSTHHSPTSKTDGHQQTPTVGGAKKKPSVKEEISRFSYRRLVNHLERKYQDIRSIFKAEKNVPRAQARLASPSLSPQKQPDASPEAGEQLN
jgi:hypothetical protein